MDKILFCDDCILKKYPACGLNIPCCKCDEKCNSRQPCEKNEKVSRIKSK